MPNQTPCRERLCGALVLFASSMLLPACSSLLAPAAVVAPQRYSFDGMAAATPAAGKSSALDATATPAAPSAGALAASKARQPVTLVVNMPHAAAGFDSARMAYVRTPHQIEYFTRSEWVDTPARMLLPLITGSLGNSGIFSAVVAAPGGAQGQLMLDLELLRFQQEFLRSPSRMHLTARAVLQDSSTRAVLAWREFDIEASASSENAYGGVLASQQVLQTLLAQLALFCRENSAPDSGQRQAWP